MSLGEIDRYLAYLTGAIRQALAVRRGVIALRARTGAYVHAVWICLVLFLLVAMAAGDEKCERQKKKDYFKTPMHYPPFLRLLN